MVERADRTAVATFFSPDGFVAGATLTLGGEVAHHARVARVPLGARVELRDGAGGIALGDISRIAKATVAVDVTETSMVARPPAIHLLPPVADRERMLWLAEKATELGLASWRPVMWRRSKSVSPRGEGPTFQGKLKARMISALIQSGGAWLPEMFPEAEIDAALAATPQGSRILLDAAGRSGETSPLALPVSIAVGPEGGLEIAEREAFLAKDFVPTRLAPHTLRFETAAVAGVAVALSRINSMVPSNG